jgi:hypothetical protein
MKRIIDFLVPGTIFRQYTAISIYPWQTLIIGGSSRRQVLWRRSSAVKFRAWLILYYNGKRTSIPPTATITKLVERDNSPVNRRDDEGKSNLWIACDQIPYYLINSAIDIASLLIWSGADHSTPYKNQITPLHLASTLRCRCKCSGTRQRYIAAHSRLARKFVVCKSTRGSRSRYRSPRHQWNETSIVP